MRKVRFVQADVFSDSPFGGNPVVVVPESGDMTSEEMQALARGMSFAETAFITRPTLPGAAFALRCFSPTTELAYSGHQLLGASYVMVTEDLVAVGGEAGELPVQLGKSIHAVTIGREPDLRVSRVSTTSRPVGFLGIVEEPESVAAAFSLPVGAIGDTGLPVARMETDLTCLIVPLGDLETLRRLMPAKGILDALLARAGVDCALVFCRQTLSPINDVHVRVFAPPLGIDEDPATGCANAALAVYLLRHGGLGPAGPDESAAHGSRHLRSEQGSEMGRPSIIELDLETGLEPPLVRVGGRVQRSVEGSVYY